VAPQGVAAADVARRPELLEDRPMSREEARLLAEVSHEESVAAADAAEAEAVQAAEQADVDRP